MSRQDPFLTRLISDCRRSTINKKVNKKLAYPSEMKQAEVTKWDEEMWTDIN